MCEQCGFRLWRWLIVAQFACVILLVVVAILQIIKMMNR